MASKSTDTEQKTTKSERSKPAKGVKESNERLPENLEVIVPKRSGFGTKRYRPNLKAFDPDSMIFLNGEDRYVKKKTPEEKALEKLRFGLDAKVKTIFTGTVIGSRKLRNALTGEDALYALINCKAGIEKYAGRTVMIAFDDFYVMQGTPNTIPPKEMLDKEKLIGFMMGAEIDFCVISIVEDEGNVLCIFGSRTMAAKEKFNRFWNGKVGSDFLIKPGSIFEGRVVRTSTNGIIAEVFGIEFFCPNKELSWNIIKDAQKEFKNGDVISLKLQSMTRAMGTVKGYVSGKDACENPMLKEIRDISVGDMLAGPCTEVHFDEEKRKTVVFVRIAERIDVYATMCATIRLNPVPGDMVSVLILGKNEEQGKAWGEVRHVEAGS